MTQEKYTFTIDSEVMKRFKKECIDLDRRFSNQVELLLDDWVSKKKQHGEFNKKRKVMEIEIL